MYAARDDFLRTVLMVSGVCEPVVFPFFSEKWSPVMGLGRPSVFFFFSKNRAACEGGLRVPLEGGTQDAQ
jgi:hypothetical protein